MDGRNNPEARQEEQAMKYEFTHNGNKFSVETDSETATFKINDNAYVTDDETLIDAVEEFDEEDEFALQEIPGWDMLISSAYDYMSDTRNKAIDEDYTFLKEVKNELKNEKHEIAQFFIKAGYTAETLNDITGA